MSSDELGQYFERIGNGSPGAAGALRFAADREPVAASTDIVEIWGHGSFPASDPPTNW